MICFFFGILFLSSCIGKERRNFKKNKELETEYSKLDYPDTIKKNGVVGNFEYYYKLLDTVKTDQDDFRLMTVYAQLYKNKKDFKLINFKVCDSFFAKTENFQDTLRCPIFFDTKYKKGDYFLIGKAIIRSFPSFYGKQDSLNAKMITREFYFVEPKPIFIQ
jgi:hypothetical protein